MCPIRCGLYLDAVWWWQAHRASYCVWEGDDCVGALGVLVHTQDVHTGLRWLSFPEDVFHSWLKVIGDKAVDNGVHAAVEATQSHCHMVDEEADIMGHVWVDGDCYLSHVKRSEADHEDDEDGGKELHSPHSPLPTLVHEAGLGQSTHNPGGEEDDYDEGEEVLADH